MVVLGWGGIYYERGNPVAVHYMPDTEYAASAQKVQMTRSVFRIKLLSTEVRELETN
jgi:hypothetical protein